MNVIKIFSFLLQVLRNNNTLVIFNGRESDSGRYTCEAENKLGEATGHVVLFETVVPICPPACDGYNYLSAGSRIETSKMLSLHILFYYSIILYFSVISFQMKL